MIDLPPLPSRIYEFLSPAEEVVGWIEREGAAVRIVTVDDGGEEEGEIYLEFPAEKADEVAHAIVLAGMG